MTYITFFISCSKIEREPKVETGTISDITTTSARAAGNIIDLGNGINDYGHCWSVTSNPTITDSKSSSGQATKTGTYASDLKNLNPEETYYVRGYATTIIETMYGNEVSFTTNPIVIPTITTNNVTSISSTSAVCVSLVADDGGAQVSDRGVCWSTNQNPTVGDNRSFDGTGTGSFTSSFTNLIPYTTYYVRAYATNSAGTAYGNQLNFKTLFEGCEIGSFTDNRDGKIYNWVKIGNQTWMAENLNYGSIINSSLNQQNNNIVEKFCLADNASNCNLYGGLYQWDEMMNYSTVEKSQGICPVGWHIPDKTDWQTLLDKTAADGFGNNTGEVLKSLTGWDNNGNGINLYGFSALPRGSRGTDGGFMAGSSWFWSSTSYWNINIEWWQDNLSWYNLYDFNTDAKNGGSSIRCIKD